MSMHPVRCAVLAAFFAATALSAQQPVTPPAFRFERPIVTGGSGPRRLPIDVALLVGGAPFRVTSRAADPKTSSLIVEGGGLTDLRLYDASGVEVGYLFVGGALTLPRYRPAAILPVAAVDTESLKQSGGLLTLLLPSHKAKAAHFFPEEDILDGRKAGHEIEFLINHGHARLP